MRHDLRRGALLLTLAALVMAVLNALQKTAGSHLSAVEILFFRNLFSIPFVMAVATRDGVVLRTQHFRAHVARSAVGLLSMGMVVLTVTRLPLAEQQVLAYTQPLFLVLLSVPLLGEQPPPQRWIATALGFSGVAAVAIGAGLAQATPEHHPIWPAIVALAQGAVAAVTVIQIRQLSRTERNTTIALWQAILMTGIATLLLPLVWSRPSAMELTILVVIGLCSGLAQLLQAEAFASAQISAIGPFAYSGLFWTAMIGWFWFGEIPRPSLFVGAVLIVAAGLWMLLDERRVSRSVRVQTRTKVVKTA